MRQGRTSPAQYLMYAFSRSRTVVLDGFRISLENAFLDPRRIRSQLWTGRYEQQERAIIRAVVRRGDRVLEAGGGLGIVSLNIARIVGVDSLLIYEPQATVAAALRENGRRNGFELNVVERVLSSEAGQKDFWCDGPFVGASLHVRKGQHCYVQADDIAAVAAQFRPNVLVIDVEGEEDRLIQRCPLTDIDLVVVESHPAMIGHRRISAMYAQLIMAGLDLVHDYTEGRTVTFMRPGRQKEMVMENAAQQEH
jgi:FkbM family methyltransferase